MARGGHLQFFATLGGCFSLALCSYSVQLWLLACFQSFFHGILASEASKKNGVTRFHLILTKTYSRPSYNITTMYHEIK
jgi:hypothetical protein